MRHVVADLRRREKLAAVPGGYTRTRWWAATLEAGASYAEAYEASRRFPPDGATRADDPFLLYFTSGTTAKPKLVLHTHQSYPVGHLSTMYWIGLREGDVHLQHQLARLGQARLELLLRAVERGRHVFIHQLPALRRREDPGGARPPRRHHPLRAAHGLAHARSWRTSQPTRCGSASW